MHAMKMAKQYGSTECGFYAIATMVCLAFRNDPTTVVFDQSMLKSHLGVLHEMFGTISSD